MDNRFPHDPLLERRKRLTRGLNIVIPPKLEIDPLIDRRDRIQAREIISKINDLYFGLSDGGRIENPEFLNKVLELVLHYFPQNESVVRILMASMKEIPNEKDELQESNVENIEG